MRWKILLAMVFAVLVALFTILNSAKVQINFLFVSAQMNLVFVILISVLLGMMLMALLWSAQTWKLRRTSKSLQREIGQLEEQLEACRQMLPSAVEEGEAEASGSSATHGPLASSDSEEAARPENASLENQE